MKIIYEDDYCKIHKGSEDRTICMIEDIYSDRVMVDKEMVEAMAKAFGLIQECPFDFDKIHEKYKKEWKL